MKSDLRFWLVSAVSVAALLAATLWLLLYLNLASYSQLVGDRLLLLAELRKGAVQEYFATAEAELRFWSTNDDVLDAQEQLVDLWQAENVAQQARLSYVENNPSPAGFLMHLDDAEDGSRYSQLHAALHPRARLFVTQRGYYDFFLISPQGDVIYTVEKEADFATNLMSGPWRDSGLAQVFALARKQRASGTMAMVDMDAYEVSDGAPAMFMGTALHDKEGEFLGVIAFQLPIDRIQGIMNYTSGMGETGETYLVGSDRLMRSDSRFSDESTVLRQRVDTQTVERALAGEQGVAFVDDYRGTQVLSVYLPMEVAGTTWAVMAEIDRDEIEQGAARQRPALATPMLFFYGLSLWSLWYWRNRQLPGEDNQGASLDFGDSGDGGGVDG